MSNFFEYGYDELKHLKDADHILGKIIDEVGHIKRETIPDLFTCLVSTIIGQQISSKTAQNIMHNLKNLVDKIEPIKMSLIAEERLRKIGLPSHKIKNIKTIAQLIVDKKFQINTLHTLSDLEVLKTLKALPGIGEWSGEMVMLFSLKRKNILSYGDFGIRKGLNIIYNEQVLNKQTFMKYKKIFSPYGSIASFYIWEIANKF